MITLGILCTVIAHAKEYYRPGRRAEKRPKLIEGLELLPREEPVWVQITVFGAVS